MQHGQGTIGLGHILEMGKRLDERLGHVEEMGILCPGYGASSSTLNCCGHGGVRRVRFMGAKRRSDQALDVP